MSCCDQDAELLEQISLSLSLFEHLGEVGIDVFDIVSLSLVGSHHLILKAGCLKTTSDFAGIGSASKTIVLHRRGCVSSALYMVGLRRQSCDSGAHGRGVLGQTRAMSGFVKLTQQFGRTRPDPEELNDEAICSKRD